jgi:CDGSH-type Zn-finger protein/uncharacterized Fe-S cluster protein YjdI
MRDEAPQSVFSYPGRDIDVTWDRRLCIHVGECTRARGEVFVSGRAPWGDPDRASADEVAEVVERCPTGALAHVRSDAGPAEAPPSENVVVVSNGGPLYVRGDLRIEGAPGDMPGVRSRVALCRCGQSANKPFCDNSHEGAAFDDRGAVGASDAGIEPAGGALDISFRPNGPILMKGEATVITGAGRRASRTGSTAFCRCGHSANKPFCDGSHKTAGFVAD